MINQKKQDEGQTATIHIPDIVWYALVSLVFLFIVLTLWFQHNNVEGFIDTCLWWLKAFFFGSLALGVTYIGNKAFHGYHDGKLKRLEVKNATAMVERKELQNEMLREQIRFTQQLPALLPYAMQQGFNVEVSPKLDVKITNFLSNVHTLGNGQAGQQLLSEATDYIPEPYKFSDVLQNFTPSKDGILLAKGRELITVPIGESLCHTTFTSSTDGGKTNNERMLLIQLAFLHQCIYLCDRNYQPFREDRKLTAKLGHSVYYDYRPVTAQLAHEPIVHTKQAVALLRYLYSEVEGRRLERRKAVNANAIVPFQDKYLFFDELPAFAGEDKNIMLLLGRLLRESRQYGVFVIAAAQDLLNATLGTDNGAIRDNLLTNFFGGGDSTTARLVLNLAKGQTIDETGLGKEGVTYLRAKGANIERVKCRTPLSDDYATRLLLADMMPTLQGPIPSVVESPATHSVVTRPLSTLLEEEPQGEERIAELSDDLLTVYNACMELQGRGEKVNCRTVAELTEMGKDKANDLMNELSEAGILARNR